MISCTTASWRWPASHPAIGAACGSRKARRPHRPADSPLLLIPVPPEAQLPQVTGRLVPRPYFAQRRGSDLANIEGVGTPGVEMAARRRVDRARHIALQEALFAFDGRIRHRNGGEQQLGIGMQ